MSKKSARSELVSLHEKDIRQRIDLLRQFSEKQGRAVTLKEEENLQEALGHSIEDYQEELVKRNLPRQPMP